MKLNDDEVRELVSLAIDELMRIEPPEYGDVPQREPLRRFVRRAMDERRDLVEVPEDADEVLGYEVRR